VGVWPKGLRVIINIQGVCSGMGICSCWDNWEEPPWNEQTGLCTLLI
jgi:hypothetical protein